MSLPQYTRRVVERLSRRLVFNRRLPRRFGAASLRVSPGAALCYFRRLAGPTWFELFEFAAHAVRRDAQVWDLGASMGVFAFAAAHVAGPQGRVLAVEADTWAAELLQTSARRADGPRAPVDVVCAAVAGDSRLVSFAIPERGRAGSHLAHTDGAGLLISGGTRETHRVVAITPEWLARQWGEPDVIKIDVEGAELDVLQAAAPLLAAVRPSLLVEVNDRNADEITALLRRHRYDLFDLTRGWSQRRPVSRAVFNTLALPVA